MSYREWAAKNPEKAKLHNERRKHRTDRRSACKWRMIHKWVKSRCESVNAINYRHYGALGIECKLTVREVARLWFRDVAWMMKRPELDRVDPALHYEFSNCRFIEKVENIKRMHEDRRRRREEDDCPF